MKASRFLLSAFRLGASVALVVLISGISLAQSVTVPVSPAANTQFGRLSWYPAISSFDGYTVTGNPNYSFAGLSSSGLSFGVYGQSNNRDGNGFGFGTFGYGGINGVFGAGAHSVQTGVSRNTGLWALSSNTDPTNTNTARNSRLSVGLEVGANQFESSGRYGWAILVDSGDVMLRNAADNNTTYIHNLDVDGTLNIPVLNFYSQAAAGAAVTASAGTSAVVSGAKTTATNNDPVFSATSNATTAGGTLYFGNATTSATGDHLLQLQSGGTTVYDVNNSGDLTIGSGAGKFTVKAGTGNTIVSGTEEVDGDFSVNTSKFTVTSASGKTTVASNASSGYALNVTNSSVAAGAATMTGNNDAGFAVNMTRISTGNHTTHHFSAGNAALNVTRGAVIDSLIIPGPDGYVHMDSADVSLRDGTLDLTGTTVTGLNDANKVDFAKTGPQTTTNNNPLINMSTSGTGDLFNATSSATNGGTFEVKNTGATIHTSNDPTNPALTLNANGTDKIALQLNGGVNAQTSNGPVGSASGSIAAGTRTVSLTINNTLVTSSSNIICSVLSAAGDSYVATVTSRSAGASFTVKITCVEGDVPAAESVTVNYWLVN